MGGGAYAVGAAALSFLSVCSYSSGWRRERSELVPKRRVGSRRESWLRRERSDLVPAGGVDILLSINVLIGSKMYCLMRLEDPSPIQKTDAKKVTPAHTHRPTLVAGTNKHDYNVSKKCAEKWLNFTVQLGHV